MKPFICSHSNYHLVQYRNCEYEVFTKPSQTVPGMVMSLSEMLARYVRGEQVTVFTPVYAGNDELMPDVERMDAMDRLDLARSLRSSIDVERNRPRRKPADIVEPAAPPHLPLTE